MTIYDAFPLLLVVLGWVVSGLYAVRQIDIAHKKNRDLQYEIINHSLNNELLKEFIQIYLKVSPAITQFRGNINAIILNATFEREAKTQNITYGWKRLLLDNGNVYSKFCEEMHMFSRWFEAVDSLLPNSNALLDIYKQYEVSFTMNEIKPRPKTKGPSGIKPSEITNTWLDFEKARLSALANGISGNAYYSLMDACKNTDAALNELEKALLIGARSIQKHLHSPSAITLS